MAFDPAVANKGQVAVAHGQPDPLRQYVGALGNSAGGLREITAWVDEIRSRTVSAQAASPSCAVKKRSAHAPGRHCKTGKT